MLGELVRGTEMVLQAWRSFCISEGSGAHCVALHSLPRMPLSEGPKCLFKPWWHGLPR